MPHKGSLVPLLQQLMGGVRASMGYIAATPSRKFGARPSSWNHTAGVRESHVHDVQITKEAPNYRIE